MRTLLLKRLVIIIPYLLAITALSFSVVYFAPGESTAMIILRYKAGIFITEEQAEQYAAEHNLNLPFKEAYFNWLKGIIRGDLGKSLITGYSVVSEIKTSFSKTLILALIALLTQVCISFPLGMYAAWKAKPSLNKLRKCGEYVR